MAENIQTGLLGLDYQELRSIAQKYGQPEYRARQLFDALYPQRLAALDPGRKEIPLLLSAVYTHLERKDQALEMARRGLALHPDDPQFLTRCAMLLMMTDNRAAAVDLCRLLTA